MDKENRFEDTASENTVLEQGSFEDTTFDEVEDVASFRECTGLFPALPLNDPAADEDLARLYAIHAPKMRNGVPCEGKGRLRDS